MDLFCDYVLARVNQATSLLERHCCEREFQWNSEQMFRISYHRLITHQCTIVVLPAICWQESYYKNDSCVMIRWYISNFVTWYWSLINGSLLILRSMLMLRTISTGLDASHWDWWMGSCANITMRNGQETRVCVWASFLEIFEELISFEVHTKLQFILEPVELHIQIRKRRATVDCYSFVAWLFFLWWI